MNVSSAVTTRYAKALSELARESRVLDKVERDIADLIATIDSSEDFQEFLASPSVGKQEQINVMQAIAGQSGFDKLTTNFLSVVIENRRLDVLRSVLTAFQNGLAQSRGQVEVQVTTAQDLSDKQIASLQAALAEGLKQEVSIKAKVEPSILGGMIVTVGSQMIDDSVARKLERLKTAMTKQANENINDSKQKAKKRKS